MRKCMIDDTQFKSDERQVNTSNYPRTINIEIAVHWELSYLLQKGLDEF